MSSTGTEQAIVSAKANVMIYDDMTKKWNPSGSSPGVSKVHIYQNLLSQTYRVVGRKIQDHEVVINCLLSKSIKYQANQTFLQWRDTKQVYGLHFQSKEDTDMFAQTMKTAVDNLSRISLSNNTTTTTTTTAQSTNPTNGDNISIGKRSISSEYNNPLIYDENDRQSQYHQQQQQQQHQNGLYTQQQRSQQQVTSPPLSNSSSSSSSGSTISSNGLTVNTHNQQQQQQMNGYHNQHHQHHQHHLHQIHNNMRQQNGGNDFNYTTNNQIYNLQSQNQQINTSSSSSSSTGSSTTTTAQQPLYQSSPIPPPPPPPSVPIFQQQQQQLQDNFSQKIYDVIPDNASYTPSSSSTSTSMPNTKSNMNSTNTNNNSSGGAPPPPPPMPTGLFSSNAPPVQTNGSVPPPPGPPPPPPIASMQSLNLQSAHQTSQPPQPAAASAAVNHANELRNSIANHKLKKVEESNRPAAAPQLDFLTEIRQKLEAKNLGNNNCQENSTNPVEPNHKPCNGIKKINRNNLLSNDSPKPIKKNTSSANMVNGTAAAAAAAHTNGMDGTSYDRLKQELMSEFRKELQMIKSDIVNSILNELRR